MQVCRIIDHPPPAQNVSVKLQKVGPRTRTHPSARIDRRDRVVMEHLPLVRAIAVNMRGSLPAHVDLDDLVHAGILGLLAAASRYNPKKSVSFPGYAKHRIKGAILDSLRKLDWASRDMRRRHKQVEAATLRALRWAAARLPLKTRLPGRLGMDVHRWRHVMVDLSNVGLVSASTRPYDNQELPAPDFPGKPEHQPDSICARNELRRLLGDAVKILSERSQKIIMALL